MVTFVGVGGAGWWGGGLGRPWFLCKFCVHEVFSYFYRLNVCQNSWWIYLYLLFYG